MSELRRRPAAPTITAAALIAIAERLAADRDRLAARALMAIAEHIDLEADPELGELVQINTFATIDTVLSMIHRGVPADHFTSPATAHDHARAVAARGATVDDLLRYYRIGQAGLHDVWAEEIADSSRSAPEAMSLLKEVQAYLFAVSDELAAQVSEVYVAERDRIARRVTARRRDLVRQILTGQPVDLVEAEARLRHRFHGPQQALLCWTDGDPATLEPLTSAVVAALGGDNPLIVPEDDRAAVGIWVSPHDSTEPDTAALVHVVSEIPGAKLAIGPVLDGLEGFRESRAAAERTRRVMLALAAHLPSAAAWRDVALIDLLTQDMPAAKAFVAAELGDLADGRPRATTLRHTVLTYMQHRCNVASTAARLHLHRNTVLQHIREAEAMRGCPVTDRTSELLAALSVVQILGP